MISAKLSWLQVQSLYIYTQKQWKTFSHTHHRLIDFIVPKWYFETNLEDVCVSMVIPPFN